ncbi:MAG: hypothetical protein OWS74_08705, partial [Firmicutes bacterium]|nr:hypothetical protein [Bacillota bacterium]
MKPEKWWENSQVWQGFLNINKPPGLSSHQVVAGLRRRLPHGVAVGHAGTLDPMAHGVLPIAVGQYTRLLEWAQLTPKRYQAQIYIGCRTQ